MSPDIEALLAAGRAAMETGDWHAAKAAFEEAVASGEVAEAGMGLGDALWWLGEIDEAVRVTERTYAALRRLGNQADALLCAVALYFVYRVSLGNVAVSRGWLERAASVVDDGRLDTYGGWVSLMRAHDAEDPAVSERWAREAQAQARASEDTDLELCALSQLGAALVGQGRLNEGMPLLDEAMAGSLAGEGRRLDTVIFTSCALMVACSQVAEVSRVAQWLRATEGFAERYGALHLHTVCRIGYGGALAVAGRWTEAESELESALRMGRRAEPALVGEGVAHLARLRLCQGRIVEAAALVAGFEHHAPVIPVVAALHLARGEPVAAASLARRHLARSVGRGEDEVNGHRAGAPMVLDRVTLLEILVEAGAECGHHDEAAEAVRELESIASVVGWDLVAACAARARGRALLASGDAAGAIAALHDALSIYSRLDMPLELGRSRLLLATALREGEPEAAAAEAQAALGAFERIGAEVLADRAAGLVRSLGGRAVRWSAAGSGGPASLTGREEEVLRLVGEGLTNRQIAERLFITVKTTEHHVGRVLAKLGVSNRAEAAAYAARRSVLGSSGK